SMRLTGTYSNETPLKFRCKQQSILASEMEASAYVDCIESEKQSLLRFKEDLTDPSNRLASWNDDGDCCTWAGVVCSNVTGHVLELHLGNLGNPDIYRFFEVFV
ncbi:hypothetical protein Ddye_027415, partial [Dipteronia dyeriana]